MSEKRVSRREFLKRSSAGGVAAAVIPGAPIAAMGESAASVQVDRRAIFAALGDVLIPTDPGDPGYRSLEPYKITEEVMKGLSAIRDADLDAFNSASGDFFDGRVFLQLTESQRADYLRLIIDGSQFADKARLRTLQRIYRQTRTRVFDVYYRNYPENVIARDAGGVPILKPGDRHQITNPNTRRLRTGWDVTGFRGQMTWEEEVAARARNRRLGLHK
ncbi:MAG: twin-arginine translocation signal domain-containing protein [Acidobacteria bacterium]|nr:twin-arginine translocation signal domain-containing protein [Acidobacteriota bacterium]MCW5970065.1 twin-arginine translocation signal domain-containing protein [Blastocatellales bacterium]